MLEIDRAAVVARRFDPAGAGPGRVEPEIGLAAPGIDLAAAFGPAAPVAGPGQILAAKRAGLEVQLRLRQ